LPHLKTIKGVIIPKLDHSQALRSDDSFEEWSLETYEWLSLLDLNSPRVLREDSIDPFLSRYQVQAGDSQTLLNLVAVTWTGLLPGEWVRGLFMKIW
jgi:ribonuclease P/MRP protein subunit RPP40